MDPDLKRLSFGQDKKIENLLNVIQPFGNSTHYFQQACISNLLVTVFAARHLDRFFQLQHFNHLINIVHPRHRA